MQTKFLVEKFETSVQPECDPAFVAKVYARSASGQTITLFPVPGATVKEDWADKEIFVSTSPIVAMVDEKPARRPKKKK